MTDEQQPDIRWAPMEPAPSNRGRIALIVGLVVAALVVVGVLLFFLLPRGEAPTPGASGSPSPSASPTASASATATPVPTTEPEPTTTPAPSMTPVTTPPPVADPSLPAFRAQVQGWLDDALTGLDIVGETSGQDAVSVIDSLQDDAQRLAESAAPGSIEAGWTDGVGAYQQALTELRSSAEGGAPASDVLTRTRQAAENLRTLVEL